MKTNLISKSILPLEIISAVIIILGAMLSILKYPLGNSIFYAGFWLIIIVSMLQSIEIKRLRKELKKQEEGELLRKEEK